jgi:hypothetical protein
MTRVYFDQSTWLNDLFDYLLTLISSQIGQKLTTLVKMANDT